MNTIKTLVGVVVALAASVVAQAQTAPANPAVVENSGLVGQRLVSLGLGYKDINNSRADSRLADLAVNLPVTSYLDVSVAYGYEWLEANSNVDSHVATVAATGYLTKGAFKPFATLGLGYVWPDSPVGRNNDRALYLARAGVEYQVCSKAAIALSGGVTDDFKNNDHASFDGAVTVNYWVTKQVAAIAKVSAIEGGNWSYSIGAGYKF